MKEFLDIKNCIYIYNHINKYCINEYNKKLNFKNFKKIIGEIMEEVHDNYKFKIDKDKANKITIKILKKIIDKKYNNSVKINNNLNVVNSNYDFNKFSEKLPEQQKKLDIKLPDRNINFYNDIINKKNNLIDDKIHIQDNKTTDVKNLFIKKPEVKKDVNITDKIKNLQEELIISPDEYLKTKQKYIKTDDIIIDTRDINTDIYNLNKFNVNLNDKYKNLLSMELISAEIPKSQYNINSNNNILHFQETNNITLEAKLEEKNYEIGGLITEIQTKLNAVGSSTYNVSSSGEKLSISSDLTGGGNVFNLIFFEKINNSAFTQGEKVEYKRNSVGRVIGFLPENKTGSNSYISDNKYNLLGEDNIYIYINKIDNVNTIFSYSSDLFFVFTFEDVFGNYTFYKNSGKSYEKNIQNEFVFIPQTPLTLTNISLDIKDRFGNYYNFYGLNYNLHLRIKYYNFENKIIQ